MVHADEGVAVVLALRDGGEDQTRRHVGWHVLQGVDGEVDAPIDQGLLDFLGEQGLAANVHQAAVLNAVAGGDDGN